jgi:hypothetical protein
MPKRKSKKSLSEANLAEDYDSDDSNQTSSSIGTASSLAMSRTMSQLSVAELSIENQVEDWIEQIGEKRGNTRESALVKIIRALSNQYLEEVISPRTEILIPILKRGLKKDGAEQTLSAKALALLWITCGDCPNFFDDTVKLLQDCIKNANDEMKAASMSSLAMIVFIEEIPNNSVIGILNYVQSIIKSQDIYPGLMQAALDAYGLLYLKASSRPDREDFNLLLDRHMELLGAKEIDVRISSGENIALFLEDQEEIASQVKFCNFSKIKESKSLISKDIMN